MLKSGESLFRDTIFLSYDFQPKILTGRENEQQRFAVAIKPLLQGYNGRNLFVYGAPGIGKTTACKHVLRELEEETDEIVPIYINCWKENTTYKIFRKICEELDYKFLHNKNTNELFMLIKTRLNKGAAVFVFDEIDKLEDTDFLYTILEDIYRKSVILITNYRDSYTEMDERIRSRLGPEFLGFRPYNQQEIRKILEQRKEYSFVPGCWEEDAFEEIIEKCTDSMDVRVGLYLMREAGNAAEEKCSRKVTSQHAAIAISKADDFHIKPKESLEEDLQFVLNLVRDNSGTKIGDVYTKYTEAGGDLSYKSFQRRINKLKEGRFIFAEKQSGKEGNTTILSYTKKLTDF